MNPKTDFSAIGYRVICSEIRQARIPHRLDCGCICPPGSSYHRIAAIYRHKPRGPSQQMIYSKQHIIGCLETVH